MGVRNLYSGGQHDEISHRAAGRGKMGSLSPDRAAAVHPGTDPRGAEVRKSLGHPCRRPKARRPPSGPAPGASRSGAAVSRQVFERRNPHAADEHPLPPRALPGGGGSHGSGAPTGHRPGGVPLLQRSTGTGGAGGGALSHQPPHGGAAVRLPALRLCQPVPGAHPAGPLCPAGAEHRSGGGRSAVAPAAGGPCLCGGGGEGDDLRQKER